MKPLVMHNLAAGALLGFSLLLLSLCEMEIKRRSRLREHSSSDWTLAFITASINASTIGAAVVAYLKVSPLPGSPWWPVIAGLVLMWAGVALKLWTIYSLGTFFTVKVVVTEHHRIIDYGPYRWLRHPCYLGMIMTSVGIGLMLGDVVSIAMMLVVSVIVFVVRIHVEEQALLDALGEEYRLYMHRTTRLVPGVF